AQRRRIPPGRNGRDRIELSGTARVWLAAVIPDDGWKWTEPRRPEQVSHQREIAVLERYALLAERRVIRKGCGDDADVKRNSADKGCGTRTKSLHSGLRSGAGDTCTSQIS